MFNIPVGLLAGLVVLNVCICEDVTIQMFSKRPLNRISERFISFAVQPSDLLDMYRDKEEAFLYKMMESGPCFLKVHGSDADQSSLFGDGAYNSSSTLSTQRFLDIYNNLRTADISPIIALPYDPINWNTRTVIKMLGKFASLGMDHITWQLGSEFRVIETIGYIDDLNTLKLIVDAVASKHKLNHWTVIGADITYGSGEQDAKMYSEYSKGVVEAVGWSQTIELNYSDENVDDFFSNINVDPVLHTILNADAPVWLTVTETHDQQSSPLTQMKQGLNLAQTLGDAAKDGFNAIYLPIDKKAWYEPSISYYVTLLHKRIIGRTVFDTKMFNGNRFDSHFYAHCTKNMSGSFSVIGVNAGDAKLDILAKLPFKSGTQYMEFVLTVSVNGRVQLNGREIVEPAVLGPVPKSKLPGKATNLNMPAYSIAFWVFTEADVEECYDEATPLYEVTGNRLKTSSERLLQDLIVESVSRDASNGRDDEKNAIPRGDDRDALHRNRRSIDSSPTHQAFEHTNEIKSDGKPNGIHKGRHIEVGAKRSKRDINALKKLFEKFELKKPIFDFKLPAPLRLPSPLLVPPIVHDVLQNPDEAEKRLFAPRDNPSLPDRDVHLEVAVDATVNTEKFNGHADYANAGPINAAPQYSVSPGNSIPATASLGELSEIEMPQQRSMNVEPIARAAPPKQENIQFVMKALPPTVHMNQANMEQTRHNLRNNLWPMAGGQPLKKLPALLPPIAQFQMPRVEVEQTFETRRRRRAIDAEAMNEAIEKRVQGITKADTADAAEDTNKAAILAQMLSMAEDIERSERDQSKQMPSQFGHTELLTKLRGKIEQMSNGASLPSTEQLLRKNDVRRKCKIIAKSVEQQCLQADSEPSYRRGVRASVNSPIKRLFASIRERVQSHGLRHKREIDYDDDVDAHPNSITKWTFGTQHPTKSNELPGQMVTKYEPDTDDPSPFPDNDDDDDAPQKSQIFQSIEHTVNRIIDYIMSRISKLSARTLKMLN